MQQGRNLLEFPNTLLSTIIIYVVLLLFTIHDIPNHRLHKILGHMWATKFCKFKKDKYELKLIYLYKIFKLFEINIKFENLM